MVTTPQHCRKYWFVFYYWYYISRCVYGQFSWQFIVLLPLTNRFSHFMPSACRHINYWFSDFYVLIFEICIYELLIDQSFCPYFCVLMIINHYLKNLPYTVGLQCLFKNYLLPEVEQHLHTSALLESRHRLKKVMT